jgi:exosortase family protein XrtF
MKELWNQYKRAILFILSFIGLYLVLNTLYGIYIVYFSPDADPITFLVSRQAAAVLTWFHEPVAALPVSGQPSIPLKMGLLNVVYVYEGCNGVNVMIVFSSFLVAFASTFTRTTLYCLIGIAVIYLMNLIRVILLFEVAFYYPDQLYLFHKYLFTGLIYAVVFLLWYWWIKRFMNAKRVEQRSGQ